MKKTNESFSEAIRNLPPEVIREIADVATIRTYVTFGEYKKLDELLSGKTPEEAKRLVNDIDDFDLGAPVHIATVRDNVRMLRLLRKHGADLNAQTKLSWSTPLMLAIEANSAHAFKYLSSPRVGVDKTITNRKGQTAEQVLSEMIQNNKDQISLDLKIISRYENRLETQEKWMKILSDRGQHKKG